MDSRKHSTYLPLCNPDYFLEKFNVESDFSNSIFNMFSNSEDKVESRPDCYMASSCQDKTEIKKNYMWQIVYEAYLKASRMFSLTKSVAIVVLL
jgi:hypothetical protein